MNLLQTLLMALKSIFSSKMRSILTMLGIIIGVCSVITLVSVMQGQQRKQIEFYENMGSGANRIYVNYSSWNDPIDLTYDLYEFCVGMPELIDGVTPNVSTWISGLRYRSKSVDTQIYFGNDKFDECMNYTLKAGRTITYADIRNRVKVCVIGARIAKDVFGLENPLGKQVKIRGDNYTVIGVYEEKFQSMQGTNDDMLLLPQSLQRTITGSRQINNFLVKAKDAKKTEEAIEKIQAFLKPKFSNEWDFWVYSDNSWMESINQSNAMMTAVVGGVAGISLFVGGIGIMNIMLVSVAERTREIGIRMAIGARRRDIIGQFLIEAATISACGGLIGIALGSLGSALLSAALLKTVFFPDAFITVGAFLFSVVLGVFFGFYPAFKASKMQPVEALRDH